MKIKGIWRYYLSPILRGVSPNSAEGVQLRLEKVDKSSKSGILDVELDEEVADALKDIFSIDKRQKAFLAGIDEDKFEYKGLTSEEIVEKLRERGLDWR